MLRKSQYQPDCGGCYCISIPLSQFLAGMQI